ncbi:MAG: tetratricopeptide repeat protein [Gammaproteobacteria bacterium]
MRRSWLACSLMGVMLPVAAKERPPTIGDLRSRPVEIRRDAPVQADPAAARAAYEQFLALDRGEQELRAEALRRLGDLKLSAGEFTRISEDLAEGSPLETRDAILLYQRLLQEYPDQVRADSVLYQLARAQEADGQAEAAAVTLERLVTQYPDSELAAEAWFRRAESLFSASRWSEAQRGYEAVIGRGPGNPFHEQSLYKLGWALFKQSEHEASIEPFMRVLDRKLVAGGPPGAVRDLPQLSRADRELVEDTFRALSLGLSYLEGAASVEAVMERRGVPPYAWLLYARLGDLYLEKQRYTDAADAYRAYVRRAPDSDQAPLLLLQALAAYTRGGFLELVVDGKREFVERYSVDQPYWNGRRIEDQPGLLRDLQTHLRDLAEFHHARAQRERRAEDFVEAARWYRQLLSQFPATTDTTRTRRLLADTLLESGQFAGAAAEYDRVAYDGAADGSAAEAAYAGVVAYDRGAERLPDSERIAAQARAQAAAMRFAAAFPEHPEAPTVLARAAKDLYDRRQYAEAIAIAQRLLDRTPAVGADKRRLALAVIGNGRFDTADWATAEGALQQLLGLLPAGDAERQPVLERLAVAIYRQGEAKQAAGDTEGAVAEWLRIRIVAPATPTRVTADYDAGALLLRARQWNRAIGVLERFRSEFPRHPAAAEVSRALALAYAESGQSAAALAEYQRLANSPQESAEVRREALWRVAELHQPTSRYRSALTFERYVVRYPQPLDRAMEARQILADFWGSRGFPEERRKWLERLVAADAAAGSQRTDRTRSLAASAALEMAAPARDAYQRIRLNLPLKKALAAKRVALERAIKAYDAAAAYGIAEVSTAATFETGELYRHLARALLDSQRPKGLADDEREQYDLLLEDQADPFNEKAIGVFEVNIARLGEGYHDANVEKTLEVLALLKAGRYGKTEDTSFFSVVPGAVTLSAARTRLEEVLRADPANALALVEYAHVLRREGRLAEAEPAYRRALALRPQDARIQRNVAVFLDLYRQLPAEALPLFERAAATRAAAGEPEDKRLTGWIAELRQRLANPSADNGDVP